MHKIITITSSHHLYKNIKLYPIVKDNQLVDRNWYNRYTLIQFKNTIEALIKEFTLLCRLFEAIDCLKIENGKHKEVYHMIDQIKFIQ